MSATPLLGRYESLDRAAIEAFVSDQQEENLHLDFKVLAGAHFGKPDMKTLAKAVSGFANSDGGIVVWGVDARRPKGGEIDCAQSIKPVRDVAALVSRLNGVMSDVVNPSVNGVVHRAVYVEADGSGVAATLVPGSDAGPHMAKAGEDRYFKRSGDSFVRLEHFDVADMFGRRPKPVLSVEVALSPAGGGTRQGVAYQNFRAIICIANSGKGSGRAPYLAVKVHPPYAISEFGVDGNGTLGLPRSGHWNDMVVFAGTADMLLHPGTHIEVLGIKGEVTMGLDAPDLSIDYVATADGVELISSSILVEGSKIAEVLRKVAL